MCGSLRLENQEKYRPRGADIPRSHVEGEIIPEGKPFKWEGFARIDGSIDGKRTFKDQWPDKEWRIVRIKAEEFTERHKETNKNVRFKTLGKEIFAIVNRSGSLRVVTRAARGREINTHHRMPVTTDMKDQFVDYVNTRLAAEYR